MNWILLSCFFIIEISCSSFDFAVSELFQSIEIRGLTFTQTLRELPKKKKNSSVNGDPLSFVHSHMKYNDLLTEYFFLLLMNVTNVYTENPGFTFKSRQ